MQCSQTGKQHCVKLCNLSREDLEPLTRGDLIKGVSLIMDYKGKPYPVQFFSYKGLHTCIMSVFY